MSTEIPPVEPLAPIVDRMRVIARDELPEPRTCRIKLWDDGTFRAYVYHSMAGDDVQGIRYERTTSEILWVRKIGAHWESESLSGNEVLHEPAYDDVDLRVIETVDPPYE